LYNSTGGDSNTVTRGYLNSDNTLDLVTTSFGSSSISLLLNNGTGTFPSHTDVAFSSGPTAVVVQDLSGDGLADIAVATATSGIGVLLNAGSGTFPASPTYYAAAGSGCVGIVASDFDGDGLVDLATLGQMSPMRLAVLLGTGGGSYSNSNVITASVGSAATPMGLAATDVNLDGYQDVVAVFDGNNNYGVWMGQSGGGFMSLQTFAAPSVSYSTALSVADWNLDGYPDLVTNDMNTNGQVQLTFLTNNAGTFVSEYVSGLNPTTMSLRDIDNDGMPDLLGDAAGSFFVALDVNYQITALHNVSPQLYDLAVAPSGFTLGDWDNNGYRDFALVDLSDANITLAPNLGCLP